MIKVTMFIKKGVLKGFESTGHAPGANAGENLMCAAMSTITFGTYYYIKYNTYAKVYTHIEENVHIVKLLEPDYDCQIALDIFKQELEMLAEHSPKSFDIFYKEVE